MSINKKCCKCGNDHADVKYYGGKVLVTHTVSEGVQVKEEAAGADVLVFSCTECGYEWVEPPLDKTLRKEEISFNINWKVTVGLTDLGMKIAKESPLISENNVKGNTLTTQLYTLMYVFGSYTMMGKPVPFDTELTLIKEL